jgi:hypothetical protein
MTDEFGNETTAPAGERVGFCQDCGKPLTAETVRTVGSGVFCEPCLELRVGAGQAVPPPPSGPYAGGFGTPVPPPQQPIPSHLPSPTLAGFLGLIPGVGAMYNGQYAKGFAHIAIFFVLTSLSDHVSGGFGVLVAGWVFYQAFEAYHTAKARLAGEPLPDPLGLNDIGERMGFGKSTWPGSASRPPVNPMNPPVTQWAPSTPPVAAPVPPVPPANWAGYVPPTAFASAPPVYPQTPPAASASQASAWGSAPYTAPSSYTAPAQAPYVPVDAATGLPTAPVPPVSSRRFPIAAIVMIALGLVFMLDITMHFEFSASWIASVVLAVLSVWAIAHRISQLHRNNPEGIDGAALVSCLLRGPAVMMLVLAALFALQGAGLYTLGQTWPVIVIAFGALMLIQRAAGRAVQPEYFPQGYDPRVPVTPTWATEPAVPQNPASQNSAPQNSASQHDAENGGQR